MRTEPPHSSRVRVKICGIREIEHGLAALDAGADFLGFVFYAPSHRNLTPRQAERLVATLKGLRPTGWQAVGIFVNEPPSRVSEIARHVGLDFAQLCGTETPEDCRHAEVPVIKVVRVDEQGRAAGSTNPADWHAKRVLLDTAHPNGWGGTGQSYPWSTVRAQASRAILAGGLRPETVAQAIAEARPWGVDVSSGVERDRRKDPELIRRFIEEVHRAG